MKQCYICGKIIPDGKTYYGIGPNSYICESNKCFNAYFWDSLAARCAINPYYEYVICDNKVYQIGSKNDNPKGFNGKYWKIQFHNGKIIETNSLWFKGEIPLQYRKNFKENARFLTH